MEPLCVDRAKAYCFSKLSLYAAAQSAQIQALFFSSGSTESINEAEKSFLTHQQGSAELIMQLFSFLHSGQLFSSTRLLIYKVSSVFYAG